MSEINSACWVGLIMTILGSLLWDHSQAGSLYFLTMAIVITNTHNA